MMLLESLQSGLNPPSPVCLHVYLCRCVQPYEPEHNSQMLLYAAMNTGQLELAEQYADASVHFPATYGPMNMADGGWMHCVVADTCYHMRSA